MQRWVASLVPGLYNYRGRGPGTMQGYDMTCMHATDSTIIIIIMPINHAVKKLTIKWE